MTMAVGVRQRIVEKLRSRVVDDATGAREPVLQRYTGYTPGARFWLGKLVPESRVLAATQSRQAAERFQPASHGFSFRVATLPVRLDLTANLCVWVALHPTLAEQQQGVGIDDDEEQDDEAEDGGSGNGNGNGANGEAGPPARGAQTHVGGRRAANRGIRVARVRMKVPVRDVRCSIEIDDLGERTLGNSEFDAAIRAALATLPPGTEPLRVLRRGGRLPREADLRDHASWANYVSTNMAGPAMPTWRAEIDIDVSGPEGGPFEVTTVITNRSPDVREQFIDRDRTQSFPSKGVDPLLYEVELECTPSVLVVPYELEQIPDSYRYDRRVPSLGVNTAVDVSGTTLRSAFAAIAITDRVHPGGGEGAIIDTSFSTLMSDPVPALESMLADARAWTQANWGPESLDRMTSEGHWSADTRRRADEDASEVREELAWVQAGIDHLRGDAALLESFKLMNRTMERVANDRYDAWRPFQIAFITGCLGGVCDPASAPDVDILWFATGGGKTEAYLGLNIIALFYERFRGRTGGAQTWARFPLRLLSLQQTQRVAESVLLAEIIRRRDPRLRDGEPFGVGYFVGEGNTPNKIYLPNDRFYKGWDPFNDANCETCRVLETCPACRSEAPPRVFFDRGSHTMVHECTNPTCELAGRLPVYVVDDDVYRWAPPVIVGTVDKLAQIGQQANFRILLGKALSRCPTHGYSASPDFCSRFGCQVVLQPVPHGFKGLNLEIQDELHLLNESLGALDGNYETLFQAIARDSGIPAIRIIAATATIEGFREQADHLYRRATRRFPMPGPTRAESFWAIERSGDPLRMYVAMLPRGTTMLNAAFAVTESHWQFVTEGLSDPAGFAVNVLGLPVSDAATIAADLGDIYEVMVTYALRKQDLERYAKDVQESSTVCASEANYDSITGDVGDIRGVLSRLEHPPEESSERIRVLGATSAISHGVDIDRLNVMTVMGMPKQTAEFIQATSRVGRKYPATVFALVNPMRVRDVSHFRYFQKYAEYLDRLVEAVPVNRESLPVLKRVLPGGLMALLLQVEEPRWLHPNGRTPSPRRDRLRQVKGFVDALDANFLTEAEMVERLLNAFAVDGTDPRFGQHVRAVEEFVTRNVTHFRLQRGSNKSLPDELDPPPPNSLRDVETPIDIIGER